jgi:hypothetical protein
VSPLRLSPLLRPSCEGPGVDPFAASQPSLWGLHILGGRRRLPGAVSVQARSGNVLSSVLYGDAARLTQGIRDPEVSIVDAFVWLGATIAAH